jgi:hypothetical protein
MGNGRDPARPEDLPPGKHIGLKCPNPECAELLFSHYRHDFRHCGCGYCFVDGGYDYLRFGWGFPPKEGEKYADTKWGVPQRYYESGKKVRSDAGEKRGSRKKRKKQK